MCPPAGLQLSQVMELTDFSRARHQKLAQEVERIKVDALQRRAKAQVWCLLAQHSKAFGQRLPACKPWQ